MVSRASFSTREPDVALPVLADYFPKVRMSNPRDEFAFEMEAVEDPLVTLLQYHLRSPRSVSAVDMSGSLMVAQVTHGDVALTVGRDSINTAEPWIFPERETVGKWDEVTVSAISLSVEDTMRFGRSLVGDEHFRLEFRSPTPIDHERSRQWTSLVSYTRRSMAEDGPVINSDIVRANAFGHLVSVLLTTFPNNAMDEGGSPAYSARLPAAVRRAVEFMDANAGNPITVEDVAQAARLSIRGLQYAFRSSLDMTPLAYLRRARLARVHAELIAADPSRGATVRDIARAWGFVHLGRFAEQYREAYGVTPRRTLDS